MGAGQRTCSKVRSKTIEHLTLSTDQPVLDSTEDDGISELHRHGCVCVYCILLSTDPNLSACGAHWCDRLNFYSKRAKWKNSRLLHIQHTDHRTIVVAPHRYAVWISLFFFIHIFAMNSWIHYRLSISKIIMSFLLRRWHTNDALVNLGHTQHTVCTV